MASSQCGFIFQVHLYGGLRCHRQIPNAVKLKDLVLYTDINVHFIKAINFCPLWSSDNYPGRF